jgi:transcriptional regulator with XRE-family HTH domain
MSRTIKAATAIPAHVTLRALRESRGLTARALGERLEDRGVKVSTDHIIAVELGQSGAGTALRAAWADELRVNPRDIHMAAELREIVAAADAESDAEAA